MSNELIVKFWGVRGSYPTPGDQTIKYGGNTACVEVRAGERTLILDAGTGIISLGRDLILREGHARRPLDLMLLISHLHHDHTQGFPFFVPAFSPQARIHIFGPGATPETLEGVLEGNQSPQTFPVTLRDMASTKIIRSLSERETITWDENGIQLNEPGGTVKNDAISIRIHRSYAHPGGVYVYRISWHGKSIVYATDTEGYAGSDRRLVQFARDADLLIHDAQYTEEHYQGQTAGFPSTQGYGHSTLNMACEVAMAAEVNRLVLFHHEPSHNDAMIAKMERQAQSLFAQAMAAYEGLEIKIPAGSPYGIGREMSPAERGVKYVQHG